MVAIILTSLWLGILTSISPCPLATNIAAVSFITRKIEHPWLVFLSGLAYTAGRMVSYAVVGYLIISSILAVPVAAGFLQKNANKLLGPILIIAGLFLMDVIKFRFQGLSLSHKHHSALADSGVWGSLLLGMIFALAFCPVSAGLFFGSLVPLALSNKAGVLLPLIYGVGTALPVLIISVAVAFGVTSFDRFIHHMKNIEFYTRKATGIVFVLVGIYYCGLYWINQ